MSKYTTEVRYICEVSAGLKKSGGYNSVKEIIAKAIPKIFDFDFPIYDEAYRTVLETKILKHYYTREIGQETIGLWKLRLDTKLNEIMPYYNKLYESALLEYNPLYTVNMTRDHNVNANGNRTTGNTEITSETSNNNGTILYSDTPQGSIYGLENNTYLTNATKNNNENSGTINRTDSGNDAYNNTEDYLEHVFGYEGKTGSELIITYRKTLLNIDMMIIDELEELFFQLW